VSDDAELAEVAERERRWRHERCEQHAAAVIAASAGLPGRAGLWVTVVVHERNGDASACVSTCLTAEELRGLGPVLRVLGEQLSATEAEPSAVASPWGSTHRSE
jgi:hypothetical protein